ncbi:hypothetical protein FOQG_00663 [Fusarium oxysporum f. sp. raphani 54005]|uniref:Uncharacterized protein n=3 Tax=Fusarium oxysporum TaxID=5507 RepID=X0D264_FUSOX|nr:hypothetical protein FOQG_00663 [Fusarium oxysporum f. sp. raphani 54005]KAG7436884.1 hypothetical protein Forpi1262_v002927 [Fusarium oxysporum f. sp. raphani]RKK82017.1 hypothetical protein BFJ69_g3304 [Fusarium oxysporum]
MDSEKGEGQIPRMSGDSKKKRSPFFVKLLVAFVIIICAIPVMFGMGVVGAVYANLKFFHDQERGTVDFLSSDQVHNVARHLESTGASYPISTKTALSTIYGVSYTSNADVVTEVATVTGTRYVTVPGEALSVSVTTRESTTEYCEVQVVTMTESYTVTVPNDMASQDSSGDAVGATVTGNPQTVTENETDFSLTSGPSDAIVTGNPQTVTESKTDFSLTVGSSDALTTASPETITKTFEVSSPLPKPHTTITIQSLYPPREGLSTVTQYTTVEKTITAPDSFITVTLTSKCPECSPIVSVSPSSSSTTTVYETAGVPPTSTTTIMVPPPAYPPYPTANNTLLPGLSGSVTVVPTVPTTTPVVVSGGTKKPEPRGWGGTSGTTNLSCTVMLVAIIMFAL